MTIKIALFGDLNADKLEVNVNEFLKKLPRKNLIDTQHSTCPSMHKDEVCLKTILITYDDRDINVSS